MSTYNGLWKRRGKLNIDEISYYANDGIICDNDYIWYYANELSSVIQVEKRTGITKVLFVIKENFGYFSYRSIAKYGDYIFVFPFRGDKYIKYNMISKIYSYKSIPDELKNLNWSAHYYQNNSFLYFYFQPPIITKFDLNTESWSMLKLCEIDDYFSSDDTKHCFGIEAFASENSIYFQLYNESKIIRLDCDAEKVNTIELSLPYKNSYIETMSYSDGQVLLIINDRKGRSKLIKYDNTNFESYEEICSIDNEEFSEERLITFYSQIIVGNTCIWLLPFESDRVLKISKDGKMMVTPEDIPVVNRASLKPVWGRAGNYNAGKMLNKIYTNMHAWSNTIVEINTDNDSVVNHMPFSFDKTTIWEQANLDIVQENRYYDLKSFLIKEMRL